MKQLVFILMLSLFLFVLWMIKPNDRVDLVHKANNRSIFVRGAIDAAIYLSKKKLGFYSMNDLLFSN